MAQLHEIRTAVLRGLGLGKTAHAELKDSADDSINQAIAIMAYETPYLFHLVNEYLIQLEPTVYPKDSTDTLVMDRLDTGFAGAAANPWVLRSSLPAISTNTPWNIQRLWDGRTIWLKNLAKTGAIWFKAVIRTIWVDNDNFANISLMSPLNTDFTGITGTFDWRIVTETYNLPPEIASIDNALITDGTSLGMPLTFLSEVEASQQFLNQNAVPVASGISFPWQISHVNTNKLPAPAQAPAITLVNTDSQHWRGPEPHGKFEYCVTYGHGKVNPVNNLTGVAGWNEYPYPPAVVDTTMSTATNTGARFRDFRIESSPSPIAPAVTMVAQQDTRISAALITVPNIEYAQGFMLTGTGQLGAFDRANSNESGVWVRIWRKRITADFTSYTALSAAPHLGQFVTGLTRLDFDTAFHLLAEIRIDPTNGGQFLDDGHILPDYGKRLSFNTIYPALRFYTYPASQYYVMLKGKTNPPRLVDDYDTLPIDDGVRLLLIQRALAIHYEKIGDSPRAVNAMSMYIQLKGAMAGNKGSGISMAQPISRPLTRGTLLRRGIYETG